MIKNVFILYIFLYSPAIASASSEGSKPNLNEYAIINRAFDILINNCSRSEIDAILYGWTNYCPEKKLVVVGHNWSCSSINRDYEERLNKCSELLKNERTNQISAIHNMLIEEYEKGNFYNYGAPIEYFVSRASQIDSSFKEKYQKLFRKTFDNNGENG